MDEVTFSINTTFLIKSFVQRVPKHYEWSFGNFASAFTTYCSILQKQSGYWSIPSTGDVSGLEMLTSDIQGEDKIYLYHGMFIMVEYLGTKFYFL